MGGIRLRHLTTALPLDDGQEWANCKSALHVQRIVDVRQRSNLYVQRTGGLTQTTEILAICVVQTRDTNAVGSAHVEVG